MGCDKCNSGFVFFTCCSGRDCGCMGLPVQVTNCKFCNKDNNKPDSNDLEIIKYIEILEWID